VPVQNTPGDVITSVDQCVGMAENLDKGKKEEAKLNKKNTPSNGILDRLFGLVFQFSIQ